MTTIRKQTGIQAARAIAALGIVYFHSWVSIVRFPKNTAYPIPGLSTHGWHAVDFFFAISGFVICLVASRPSFEIRSFLIKRVFRLYPLWLTMLTVFGATAWLWRGLQPRESLGYFLYSATLLPTYELPFYDVGWSLQHEMAFYVIAAVLVPLSGIAGLATSLAVSTIAVHSLDLPWYIAMFARHHAEFLAGVLAFMLHQRLARLGFLIPFAIGIVLTWLLLAEALVLFPLALFFLVVAFANLEERPSWWQRLFTPVGDASYSIYLIHPVVYLVASAVVSRFSNLPNWLEEPIRFGSIAVIIVLALVSWRYFETPIIALGNAIASRVGHKGAAQAGNLKESARLRGEIATGPHRS